MIHFCQKLLIYANKKYYRIENHLKLLKLFKFCLYVKQNSQNLHSLKLSLLIWKVGSHLTSSQTPFPNSHSTRNSLHLFSVISAFNGTSHCENRPLARVWARGKLSVTQKNLCAMVKSSLFSKIDWTVLVFLFVLKIAVHPYNMLKLDYEVSLTSLIDI